MTTAQITYGNIRKPNQGGLFGLPLGAVVGLFPLVLMMIALAATNQWTGAGLTTLVMGAVVLPAIVPARQGRTLYQRWGLRLAHSASQKAGHNVNIAGVTGRTPDGKCRLPGLLAPSVLTDQQDSYGNPFGLITLPHHRHHTIVIDAYAEGSEFDQNVLESKVAHWGAWLANLDIEGAVVGASVTVETAPDSGLRLRRMLVGNVVAGAPQFALATVGAITAENRADAPAITTRIAITFSGRGDRDVKDRTTTEMAVDISNRLPALLAGLRSTGAGTTVRLCTAQDITDFTRAAFDPSSALAIEEARADGGTHLTWDEAGPVFHQDGFDVYRHDRAYSTTFEMAEGPRGIFYSNCLQRLLAPQRDIDRKRVTLLYRPVPNSAQVVEKNINSTIFTTSGSRRQTARGQQDMAAAKQAAVEEAAGAGLVRFGMIVTVTTTDPERLAKATRAVTSLVGSARLKLRVALGNQAVAFAAGLPLGVVLPEHTLLPTAVRDFL
jgi:hypothetical protein